MCQSTAPNPARESFLGRFTRIFSIYFTHLFLRTSITPNQITVLSVFVFFSGILCFFSTQLEFHLFALFLIFFSIVLDGCDGEVARYRKSGRQSGIFYTEPVSHDIQYGLMFPLISVALFVQGYSPVYLILGMAASIAKLLYRAAEMHFWPLRHGKADEKKIEAMKQQYHMKPVQIRFFYWVNKNFFSSCGVLVTMIVLAPINHMDWYLWIYAVAYSLLWFMLLLKHIRIISKELL